MFANRAICVAIMLTTFVVTSPTWASKESPGKILDLVHAGETAAVESMFHAVAANTKGSDSDYLEYYCYQTFVNSNPALTKKLDLWVSRFPDSPYALTARGLHHYAIAMQLKGESETIASRDPTNEQFIDHLKRSAADLNGALEKNRAATVSRAALIQVMVASGDSHAIQQVTSEGLRISPGSFAIRLASMQAESPKWGGSFELLSQQTDDALDLAEDFPSLGKLQGFGFATLSEGYSENGDTDKALSFAGEAAAMDLDEGSHITLAKVYFEAGDPDMASKHLDQAISLYPARVDALYWKGRTLLKQENTSAAEEWFDRALALNPAHTDSLRYRAWLSKQSGDIAAARTLYERALANYGAGDPNIVTGYQSLLVNDVKDFDRAADLAEQSGHLFQGSRSLFWYYYGVTLAGQKSCLTVAAMKRYQENCAGAETLCRSDALARAEKQIRALVDPGRCEDMPALPESGFSS